MPSESSVPYTWHAPPDSIAWLALHSIILPTLITGKVTQVKEGDTVVISPIEGGQFFICRLHGIDAPEKPNVSQTNSRAIYMLIK